MLAGPGAPDGWVEVPGAGDAGTAIRLGGRGPGDAQPAAWAAADVQLTGFGPVVDDAGAAAEPAGGFGDADLGAAVGRRAGDLVGVTDPLDGFDVERAARAGAVSALGEQSDQVGVAGDGTEFADQPGGRGRRGGRYPGGAGPVDDDLVGGSGVPADPDPGLGPVGFGQQGDVGDQGAQQPLAVARGGGGGVPQRRQVSGEFFQAGPVRQRWQGVLGGLQGLPGVGERGEPGFPPGFQGAGDQPVLRLNLAEGPLSAVGLIPGAFDGQLGCAAGPLALAGHLAGGGERERDLLGGEGLQQHAGDGVVDRVRGDAAAAGGFLAAAAGVAFVAGPPVAVVAGCNRAAAAAADDDPLAQRGALPDRPAAAPCVVGGQPCLDRQVL